MPTNRAKLYSESAELTTREVGDNRFLYGENQYGLGFPKTPVDSVIISVSEGKQEYLPGIDVYALHIGGTGREKPGKVDIIEEGDHIGSLVMSELWGVAEIYNFSHQLLKRICLEADWARMKNLYLPIEPSFVRSAIALGFEPHGRIFIPKAEVLEERVKLKSVAPEPKIEYDLAA